MLQRATPNGEVLLFRYEVGCTDWSDIANLAVAFRDARSALPEFVLYPRTPLDDPPLSWLAGRVPREQQVVFHDRQAFMDRFVLYGSNPAAIEPVFTNKRLDFLESECLVGDPPPESSLQERRRWHARAWRNTWSMEGNGQWLLMYRPMVDENLFEPLRPGDMDRLLESVTRLHDAFMAS